MNVTISYCQPVSWMRMRRVWLQVLCVWWNVDYLDSFEGMWAGWVEFESEEWSQGSQVKGNRKAPSSVSLVYGFTNKKGPLVECSLLMCRFWTEGPCALHESSLWFQLPSFSEYSCFYEYIIFFIFSILLMNLGEGKYLIYCLEKAVH